MACLTRVHAGIGQLKAPQRGLVSKVNVLLPGRCRPAPLTRPCPQPEHQQRHVAAKAAADTGDAKERELDGLETAVSKVVGVKAAPAVVTLGFITLWYALNVYFNLLNKSIFKYFPFPYTVSTVHVIVGTAYCALMYVLGFKKASFGRAITKDEFGKIFGPAFMHAIGHIAANISFAAVAISLTHTVKTLEPAFNVILSRLILGESTPLPVMLTLIPIMAGVGLASAGELSFNWTGFISAMLSNLTFGFRAVWGKAAMTKTLDSTAVYAYTTLISMVVCLPFAIGMEGGLLKAGAAAAIAKVGESRFYTDLFMVGLLYHLYNQFAFNTLQRVSPVSHGVCNVVKRVVIIFSSVIFFNQVLTQQALIGTVIALVGTWLYTSTSAKYKHKKPEAGGGGKPATA
eukprot:GHUV01001528.1.p1 GENE.GHUV01001528.1~~GHUV01001528.1.p1  ORF type:complete len:401 (+),score=111.93 GHUV01001528.1:253-1455(+)